MKTFTLKPLGLLISFFIQPLNMLCGQPVTTNHGRSERTSDDRFLPLLNYYGWYLYDMYDNQHYFKSFPLFTQSNSLEAFTAFIKMKFYDSYHYMFDERVSQQEKATENSFSKDWISRKQLASPKSPSQSDLFTLPEHTKQESLERFRQVIRESFQELQSRRLIELTTEGGRDQNARTAETSRIFYVKMGANGDGISWDVAAGDIQTILTMAQEGDEIWVAAGTAMLNFLSTVTIEDCVFDSNLAADGIIISYQSDTHIKNTAFRKNRVVIGGVALCFYGNLNAENLQVEENHATDALSGIFTIGANAEITNCTFRKNTAYSYYSDGTSNNYGFGGALGLTDSRAIVYRCKFIENETDGTGGTVAIGEFGMAYFISCLFEKNKSKIAGVAGPSRIIQSILWNMYAFITIPKTLRTLMNRIPLTSFSPIRSMARRPMIPMQKDTLRTNTVQRVMLRMVSLVQG